MMEVENTTETVNLKETSSCLSTNFSRDDKCKREELMNTIMNDSNKNCVLHCSVDCDSCNKRSSPQPADSIEELSDNCQKSFQQDVIKTLPKMVDDDKTKNFPKILDIDETKIFPKMVDAAYRSQVIRDNMKANGDKCPETRTLNSDPDDMKATGDKCPETGTLNSDCDDMKATDDRCTKTLKLNSDCDDMKSTGEKCTKTRILISDPDTGECCGQSHALGSPGDVSSNEEIPAIDDSSSYDARRTRRKSKRKLVSDFCCPVCSITVREPELAAHYAQEVEKLTKIPGNLMKLRPRKSEGISTTFVQVKSNRENRLTAKVAKYAAKASKEIQCPICKLRISGHEDDINKHVALCVQNEEDFDEHIVVDDDDDEYESFEENEVHTYGARVEPLERPITKRTRYDENEEVEVDIDDTKTYGEPQYTELDVITNYSDGNSEELRKAVLGNPLAQPHVLESRKWSNIVDDSCDDHKPDDSESNENVETTDQTVTSLKEKIKDLEDQNRSVKCLICMESYTKPVVSTTCWHVHCEECWLMTMGVKKLCPQCNMIVFPSDLRKIYL